MPILEMLLSWTNNALVRKEGRYEVLPVKDAIPGNLTPRIAPPKLAMGYEMRVFPLKYISATEMQKLLKPYAKADAIVNADAARSMIIMAGTAAELANYQRTIDVFDVDWLKGMSVGVYNLRNTDVTKVQPELDKIFGEAGQSPLAGMFRFIPMDTTNSIIVITSQPDYLQAGRAVAVSARSGRRRKRHAAVCVQREEREGGRSVRSPQCDLYRAGFAAVASQGNVAPGLRARRSAESAARRCRRNWRRQSSLMGSIRNSTARRRVRSHNGSTNGSNRWEYGGGATANSNLSTTGTGTPNARISRSRPTSASPRSRKTISCWSWPRRASGIRFSPRSIVSISRRCRCRSRRRFSK